MVYKRSDEDTGRHFSGFGGVSKEILLKRDAGRSGEPACGAGKISKIRLRRMLQGHEVYGKRV